MGACGHTHIYIYTHVNICMYAYAFTYTYTYTYTYTWTYAYAYTYTYAYAYTYTYTHVYMFLYSCIHVLRYSCVCIQTYIHTYLISIYIYVFYKVDTCVGLYWYDIRIHGGCMRGKHSTRTPPTTRPKKNINLRSLPPCNNEVQAVFVTWWYNKESQPEVAYGLGVLKVELASALRKRPTRAR